MFKYVYIKWLKSINNNKNSISNKTFVIGHSCAASYELSNDDKNRAASLSSEFLPSSIVKPVNLKLKNSTEYSALNLQFLCNEKLAPDFKKLHL